MAIEFATVRTTLEQTDTEVTQYNQALAALGGAKDELAAAQEIANTKQAAVTVATSKVGTEKEDVVTGITQAIAQLSAILAELQE